MSKYNKQNRLDEKAVAVISNFFSNEHGDLFDLQFHGIKDNTPDTDGFLRLREKSGEMEGTYLNKVVFFQLKGKETKIENNSYTCSKSLINFCKEINLPTILFVVGSLNGEAEERNFKEIYWYHFNNLNSEMLDNQTKQKSPKTIKIPNLEPLKIGEKDYITTFYSFVKDLAKKDSFQDLPKEVLDLSIDYKNSLIRVSGIIYLLGKVQQVDVNILSDILNLNIDDIKAVLKNLRIKELIYFENNLIFFRKVEDEFRRDIGLLLLHEAIGKIDLYNVFKKFFEFEKRKNIFESLSKVKHPIVDNFLVNEAEEFKNYFLEFKNNNDIFENLELLERYMYKTPNQAIQILKKIINSKNPLNIITRNIKGWGKVKGKSHDDLVEKSVELLEKLRYIKPKDTLSLLLKLSNSKEKDIQEKAKQSLERLVKYNLLVLQKIGYQPQVFFLDEIEKFEDRKLLTNFDAISRSLKQIINPSLEWDEMTDYETMNIYYGGLSANGTLKKVRERAIEVLQKLFRLSKTIPKKKNILQILREATLTPHGNYTKELEELILGNTNTIIEFYSEVVKFADHEIVKEIEEQLHWFVKRYSDKLNDIEKLQALIAQNDEYDMFKVFVGYDYRFDEHLDWRDAEKERKQKIQEFIEQISDDNFDEWQNKVLSVINNYNQVKDYGRYQYFNIFLNELGKQKPEIAKKLIQNKEKELEEFLIHLVAGIWKSKNKKVAVKFIEDFIANEKHLSLCTYIFSYVKEIDDKLLKESFEKAKQNKDINALNNVIRSIVDNYPDDERHKKLFIETIKELTKLKNYWWINSVWFRKELIIEVLSEKDFDVTLSNLLLVENIDYETETILKAIAIKYPLKVVKFFEERVNIQSKKKRNKKYDAIPYDFHELSSDLQKHAKVIIPEVLKWFKKKERLFKWEGGHFLKNIYSINELDDELVKLLNTKNEEDLEIVLSIFRTYQGHINLDSKAAQTLIKKHPKNQDDLINSMAHNREVVVGEYGFVDSLKDKKDDLQKWKNDKRKYIQGFIEKYEEYLDKQIDYEKKRADEDLELRKHGYK